MDIIAISIVALFASGLTMFSGFGLGTLLMPVVAIFFPVEIAIAMTAIVHLANNAFKVFLLGRSANRSVLVRFGIPAVVAAFLGALVLGWLAGSPPLFQYWAFGKHLQVLPIKLVVGILILVFVFLELSPAFAALSVGRRFLPLGGVISGFFGGLSGHQGAFRSMFLLKAGLTKEEFVATGVVLAVMVDLSRMIVYGSSMTERYHDLQWAPVIAASVSAFIGAYFGSRLLRKITIRAIRGIVSALLAVVAAGLITGAL